MQPVHPKVAGGTVAAGPTTDGVSPKTLAAGAAPLAGGILIALVNYAITGTFDSTSIAAVIGGSGGGLVSGAAAYIAKPGPIRSVVLAGEAVFGSVMRTDPGLVEKVKADVLAELAKLPAGLQPVVHAVEADAALIVDPSTAPPDTTAGPA